MVSVLDQIGIGNTGHEALCWRRMVRSGKLVLCCDVKVLLEVHRFGVQERSVSSWVGGKP